MKKILYLIAVVILHETPAHGMHLIKNILCCCCPHGRVAPEELRRISPSRKNSVSSVDSSPDSDPIAQPFSNRNRPARLTIPSREQAEGSLTPQNSPVKNRATTPSRSISDSEFEFNQHLYQNLKSRYSRTQKTAEIGNTLASAIKTVCNDIKHQYPYAATPASHLPDRDFENLETGDYFELFHSSDNLDEYDDDDLKKPSNEFPMIPLRKPKEELNDQELRHRIRRLEQGLNQIEMEEYTRKEQLKREYILQLALREKLKTETACHEELKSETMSPCNEEKDL